MVRFDKCIIAAGSQVVAAALHPDDPRIVDSTGALELRFVPKRMLVIGGGIIGLEMATVYSALGARIEVVEMLDGLMQGPDRDLVKMWEKKNAKRFEQVMLETRTVAVEAKTEGLLVSFAGAQAPAEPQLYDMILQSVGRKPNGNKIGADKAGVTVSERGIIPVDSQMRTNVPHIYAVGDIVGQPMLAHKAVHEAHVAAEAAAGHKSFFDAAVIPSVAYTDPEVAWVGADRGRSEEAGAQGGRRQIPLGGLRPRHRQRPRRGLHQADLRRGDPSHGRRRHRRHQRRRPDRRNRAGDRDGLPTPWTSARPSIRIRPWASRSAWRPKCSRACAPICRRPGGSNGPCDSTEACARTKRVRRFVHP